MSKTHLSMEIADYRNPGRDVFDEYRLRRDDWNYFVENVNHFHRTKQHLQIVITRGLNHSVLTCSPRMVFSLKMRCSISRSLV